MDDNVASSSSSMAFNTLTDCPVSIGSIGEFALVEHRIALAFMSSEKHAFLLPRINDLSVGVFAVSMASTRHPATATSKTFRSVGTGCSGCTSDALSSDADPAAAGVINMSASSSSASVSKSLSLKLRMSSSKFESGLNIRPSILRSSFARHTGQRPGNNATLLAGVFMMGDPVSARFAMSFKFVTEAVVMSGVLADGALLMMHLKQNLCLHVGNTTGLLSTSSHTGHMESSSTFADFVGAACTASISVRVTNFANPSE